MGFAFSQVGSLHALLDEKYFLENLGAVVFDIVGLPCSHSLLAYPAALVI